MYPQFLILAGFAAAGAMAVPHPVNGTATWTNTTTAASATTTFDPLTVVPPPTAATAIVLVPEVFEGLSKNGTKEFLAKNNTTTENAVVPGEATQTPLKELTAILDRVSDKVFSVTSFVNQTMASHGRHISEEHAHTVADVVALPMAVLHGLLDHVTAHVRNMHHHHCSGSGSHHLLSELPIGHGAAGANPEVLAVLDKTRNVVTEISATARHLIDSLGLTHVAEVVHPVMVAAKELMLALEDHFHGKHDGPEAAAPSRGCRECDEDDEDCDDEDCDEDDDDECCSHGHHSGFHHGIKSKLRGMAVRYLHRHFKSIFRFLLGDLGDIIDDVEQYYDAAYDGPDYAGPAKMAANPDPKAVDVLMDHIGKVGQTVEFIQTAWGTPEAIETFFAEKDEEVEE